MSLKMGRLAGLMLGVLLVFAWTGAAQDNPPKSTVGEKVDNAVKNLKKGAQEAGDAVRQQYEKARAGIHNMSVAARVYGRLHWDKALHGSKVDVDVHKDGVATLTGTVADLTARAKAVELTRDTVGVASVVDRLSVQTPTTTAPRP